MPKHNRKPPAHLDRRTALGRKMSRCRYFEVTESVSGYTGHRCPNFCTTGTYYHMCAAHADATDAGKIRQLKATLPSGWIAAFYASTDAKVDFDAAGRPVARVEDAKALPSAIKQDVAKTQPSAPAAPAAPQAPAAPKPSPVDRFTSATQAWRTAADKLRR